MTPTEAAFLDRFQAIEVGPEPLSLQILFFEPPSITADSLSEAIEPHRAGVSVELCPVASLPNSASGLSNDGPPASVIGLIRWPDVVVKFVQFDAPMPYGPVEACVGPALIPPPMKVDAAQHQAHALLYLAGDIPDPVEGYVILCVCAAALAQQGGIVVLNEEARTAIPALDLIPEDGEDAQNTYRSLPIPYLFGGFVRMDAEHAGHWVRTFANHRLGLPNLAQKLKDDESSRGAFQIFSGLLGYLRQMGETFQDGDLLDLGEGIRLKLRVPTETEWFLESPGTMFVLEAVGTDSA